MIWGCMEWNEVNILSDIEGGMDDESLVIILEAGLLKNIKKSNILKMLFLYYNNHPKQVFKREQN